MEASIGFLDLRYGIIAAALNRDRHLLVAGPELFHQRHAAALRRQASCIGFPPGGSADINARSVAQQLGKELGGTVIIENKGGAGGNIGAIEVKKSAPDGYTVFYATSAVVLAPSLYANPGFDPYTDFVPISLTATIPLVLVVNNGVPAKTFSDFVNWGKSREGTRETARHDPIPGPRTDLRCQSPQRYQRSHG